MPLYANEKLIFFFFQFRSYFSRDISELPMYGGVQKTPEQIQADKQYVNSMVEKYGTTTFEYDANGRPTKIDPYSIEWSEDGFTQTHPDWPDRKTVYLVNSNNQIESEIELWQNEETKNHDTVEICNYYWTGDTQLRRVYSYYGKLAENQSWEENYSFGTGWNPVKGFNIAMVVNSVGEWAEWVEPQNLYCTTKFSDRYLSADIVYEFDDNNFPVRADIKYNDSNEHEYMYFEYETY